ncbi:MAG: mechanosensitive ion channel [Deltaproteobacteria bacterium]|nr:mechanosensitive ion channel [Deltaproteobacteria bacterium]
MDPNVFYVAMEEVVKKFLLVIPNLAAAIAILVIGYIIARIIKAVVIKVLTSAKVFGKLEEMKIPDKERPVELIGRLAFYLVMLFVLLTFFNVLNLPIIAGPVSTLVNTVMEYLPRVGGAAIILIIAWIIAKMLKLLILKGLGLLKFDEKVSKYFKGKPSEMIAGITFYLVLLFALPPFLEALKLSSVTKPLSDMWGEFTGILPNLLAAAIIILIGFFIAKIVQEILVNLLVGFGIDRGAERIGIDKDLKGLKISGMIGTVVYILVLIPVFIAALDALNIPSISGPGRDMLTIILNKLPSIFAASIILVLAIVLGRILQTLLSQILAGVGFDRLLEALGLKQVGNRMPSQVVGIIAFVYILFFAVMEAAEVLHFGMLANLSGDFIVFVSKVILSLIILGAGILIGNWVKGLTQGAAKERPFLATLAKVAIVVFALAIALQNLGIANEIVTVAFGLLLGAIAIAAAIAFGIGSKDIAGREVDIWVKKLKGEK